MLLLIFLGSGAAGMYLASEAATFPVAMGGNASALGVLCAWAVRDLRDRQAGEDTETDLFGVIAIAAVLGADAAARGRPPTPWAGLAGAAVGCVAGLLLPKRS